jgi:hypothetical protein
MLKKLLDFFWIISSMSLYILFFKISNIRETTSINIFNNIEIFKISISTDYILIAIIALSSFILLPVYKKIITPNDTLKINSIKVAEPIYIPVYVAYFVIAMSITTIKTFCWITLILFLLIRATKMFYFNPILLLFGYHFYEAQDKNETCLLLISKKTDLKGEQDFQDLYRLNNFTFLDLKGD